MWGRNGEANVFKGIQHHFSYTKNVPNSDVPEKCANMSLIGYYFIKRVLRLYFGRDSPDMEVLFSIIVEETVRVVPSTACCFINNDKFMRKEKLCHKLKFKYPHNFPLVLLRPFISLTWPVSAKLWERNSSKVILILYRPLGRLKSVR